MSKEVLHEIVEQNQYTSHFSFDQITEQNATLRLNDKTASIGFLSRHIGEMINLFGHFFDIPTDVVNTTMGQVDIGQPYDLGQSKELIERGFKMLDAT